MPTPRKPLLSPEAAAFVHAGDTTPPAAPADAQNRAEMTKPAGEPEARVRFTVDLPRSLHKRLKQTALDRELPMTDLARAALEEWLDSQA